MSAELEIDVQVKVGQTLGVSRAGQKGQNIDTQVSKVIRWKAFL